ncbi:ATP-dependent DNA helicase RecG [Fusibacillus kribbianus]|uniref:ATP-dependent DNA helicase RecG n=1 Tax=Fusibacillus kribbianus TaxID=3044208 RepID=A0AAP4B8I2_9FIRM|nr:ATP-dependent DNA helicase RecG [Ruminococcus sp. YH-rum2234]MDI9241217.1 ATP-dependent DNA helicase RecG [Ruminococcus sp. YH-rum2234]
MRLTDSVTEIKGIGEKTAKLMEKVNIRTVGDLILSYPRDYDRYEPPADVGTIKTPGIYAVAAVIPGRPEVKLTARVKVITANLKDDSGILRAVWFNMPYLANVLKPGGRYIFRGRVVRNRYGLVMEQPAVLGFDEYDRLLHTRQPVYNLTAGLTNKTMRKAVYSALEALPVQKDYLPEWIRKKEELSEYNYAVRTIHFPKNEEELLFARKRLVFDEFFLFILCLRLLRGSNEKKKNGFPVKPGREALKLQNELPYDLTGAQKETLQDILKDMGSDSLMSRLVQGDVGSGKTIVAVLALLSVVESGYQGAMMAPTEVLARQHYESVTKLFSDHKIPCRTVLLTGSMTAKEKRLVYEQIAAHEADIIIGTHALIQDKVVYDSLGLVITDEQHRFGVRQRELFSKKGGEPHVLVMSATPIPRTLAIILYGDLDISVMDELPAKRLPIKNCVVGIEFRPNAYKFIAKEVASGRQAYVICPMVEESELMEGENVVDYAKKLRSQLPPSIRVEYLHGRMSAQQKDAVMGEFAENRIQVLVSTTVIEVGVDVPNATVMMIENAERFGLAQLHQLRGRVGRGGFQSYCIFINASEDSEKNKRLEILNKSNDGFYIALEDLKLRGPGDIFGLRQSGLMEFAIGDVFTDADILKEASEAADAVLKEDGGLTSEKYRVLRERIDLELFRRVDSALAL